MTWNSKDWRAKRQAMGSHFVARVLHGKVILKWLLKDYNANVCTRFVWCRAGSVEGCYEYGNETFDFHKRRKIIG